MAVNVRWASRSISAAVKMARGVTGRWLSAGLLFLLAAIVQTWPLVLHASDSFADVPAQPGDSGQFLWNLWWVKYSLLHLQNPYHTNLLFYPQGADLYLHALTPVNGIMSIPLQLATGNLLLSWNILAVILFTLSGLTMYALAYHVTRHHGPALLAGFLFAFSPRVLMHFQGGEWNISTVWPIPLFMLFLLRFGETWRLRDGAAAGVAWAVITYNWLEYGVDAGLFLGLFLSYWSAVYLLRRDWKPLIGLFRGMAVIVAVWFALSSPLLLPAMSNIYGGNVNLPTNGEFWSADLLAFVTPSPLWGPGLAPESPGGLHNAIGSLEAESYLGFVALLLAGLALLRIKRRPHQTLFWAIVFFFFAVLSLGPTLYVNGNKDFSLLGLSFTVPLPYQLYDKMPLISERRITSRIVVFAIPALSILAATGFDLITSSLRRNQTRVLPVAVGVVIASLAILDYWSPPVQLNRPAAEPAIFSEIRNESGDFAVLDVPLGRSDGSTFTGDAYTGWLSNYYQTMHEKRVFGGYLSRVSSVGFDWIVKQPGLHFLSCTGCPADTFPDDLNTELVRKVFRQYDIRYVVVHKRTPEWWDLPPYGASLQVWDRYLSQLGFTQIFDDPILTVYRYVQ